MVETASGWILSAYRIEEQGVMGKKAESEMNDRRAPTRANETH
jgi:hypothetical protein